MYPLGVMFVRCGDIMQLIEQNTKNFWDELINQNNENGDGLFLQSWQWGQFQKKSYRKVFYLAEFKNKKSLFQSIVIKHPLPLGKSYLYCPRGPIINRKLNFDGFKEVFLNFIKTLYSIAHEEKAIFFKLEPPQNWSQANFQKLLQETRFNLSDKAIQPSQTILLDLKKSELEIQAKFKPKTRYNIKLALRHNVYVKEDNKLEKFWSLLGQTAKRDKFKTHPKAYYQQLIESFPKKNSRAPFVKLFLAQQNQRTIASALYMFHFPIVYYLHGAFDYNYRASMSPFLLHWKVIQEAKNKGFTTYDFWGINSKRWPGVTRFKESFGGRAVQFPGSFDLVFDQKFYKLYQITRKLKEILL